MDDQWENEGGYVPPLTACVECGKVKPLFHEGYCLACWVELNRIER